MNKNFALESRILRLEKLFNEENINSKIEPNIFSDDIDDVRMAIKEQQSLEQTDKSGNTPIVLQCRSKNPNIGIAKLLLDNGADPNVLDDKEKTCLVNAINVSSNLDLIKLLVDHSAKLGFYLNNCSLTYLALEKGIRDIDTLTSLIIKSHTDLASTQHTIEPIFGWCVNNASSDEYVCNELLNYIFNSGLRSYFFNRFAFDIYIQKEFSVSKTMVLFNNLADHGVWSFKNTRPNTVENKILFSNKKSINTLYNGLLKILSSSNPNLGRLDYFIDNVVFICNKLKKPIDTLLSLITPEIMSNAGIDAIENLLYKCIESGEDVNLFKSILDLSKGVLKTKADDFKKLSFIILIASKKASKEMTTQVIRLIRILHPDFDLELLKEDSFLKSIGASHTSIGSMLATSHNKLLIDYFVDQGYGGDIRISVMPKEFSEEAREALRGDKSLSHGEGIIKSNQVKRNAIAMMTYAITYIKDDDHPNVINLFNMYPELVNIEEFYKEAVKLSSDSFNARQAVRYIDSHKPKKPEKSDDEFSGYDM